MSMHDLSKTGRGKGTPFGSAPQRREPSASFEVPLEMLSACHLRIEQRCDTLRRLVPHLAARGADPEAREAAASVLRYFDTAAIDHHADEEEDLFPALIESMAGSDAVCIRDLTQGLAADHRELEARWSLLRSDLREDRGERGRGAGSPRRSTSSSAFTSVTSLARRASSCRWRLDCWATTNSTESGGRCASAEASGRTSCPRHERRPEGDGRARACSVLTVGHSTRPIGDFLELLVAHGVTQLLDVRTVPKSRHNPQFGGDSLAASLAAAGIGYTQASGLGGFRRPLPDSPNSGWRNLSFRGYADYMQTADFQADLMAVIELAQHDRVALMCAEAVPWRCHRSLIADALLVHGVASCEIASATRLQPHRLTPFARIAGQSLTYPPAEPEAG